MKAPKNETTFEQLAEGSYPARLYSIVELGTETFEWQGEEKKAKKIRITFEMPEETKEFAEGEGEKPYIVSKDFTFSMHPKSNLRPFIEAWIGKFKADNDAYEFDIDDLIGRDGLVSVVHNISKDGRAWLDLSAIVPLPKGMKCAEAFNTPFTLYYQTWDQAAFDTLPEWIQEKMKETPEYKEMMGDEEEIDVDKLDIK